MDIVEDIVSDLQFEELLGNIPSTIRLGFRDYEKLCHIAESWGKMPEKPKHGQIKFMGLKLEKGTYSYGIQIF